ncbi:MAG: hypothetical protein OXC53_00240, partial [Rhodobacteraceae bacterium]|nr:hypothetical protein [Paracoccaceae bacterium]
RVFRAFLRRCFNQARSAYDSDNRAALPDGGDVLVKSLGVVSLAPLRSAVLEALETGPQLPGLFDESDITDRKKSRDEWHENTADNIRNALNSVKYGKYEDDEFVKFRLSDNSIVINKKHPFVAEHSRTKAEKKLMCSVAMVNYLADIYALEAGVMPETLDGIRNYRDRLMRIRAMQDRQSGVHIAQILLATQHKSSTTEEMEAVLADAFRYLGYHVDRKGGPGEPEGIASAVLYSTPRTPSEHERRPPLYRFTFDAKSTKHARAKTGNLSLDGIKEHQKRYEADYALVVAPDFQDGAAATRCEQQGITPVRASDIGKLLEYTAEQGAIPLDCLRSMFELHDPDAVSDWVRNLRAELESTRKLTIDIFLEALNRLRGKVSDVLSAELISYTCREELAAVTVQNSDVLDLVRGLAILVPDLIGVTDNEKIIVNAAPDRVADAIRSQLEQMHGSAGAMGSSAS